MEFATRAWIGAIVEALNAHPGLPAAIGGLGPDLALVVERSPGFARSLVVWGRQAGGRIAEWRFLHDEDELLELEPAYVVRAPYQVWKELLRGGDPVQAALSGRVKVKGDLEALLRRAAHRPVADAALAAVATEFPDERGGGR
ncbi:MAG TPA: SCP2 sterol-binding domain-containing protein [Anaeromyxobacteraceae bacterium]|nr:SCP2 sterol-binding domain-containing protein [Anaeromyxobacteraceae bacterium]